MYVDKLKAIELLETHSMSIAVDLKDKVEFMRSLLEADDWSMIIKTHALIETIITELIITCTEEDKLKPLIERLPLSDEQIGKLRILKDYNLLTVSQRLFIKRFSELRNMTVHKLENINFNLEEYINTFDKNQKKSWIKTLTWYTEETSVQEDWGIIILHHPKIGLWFSTMMLVSLVSLEIKKLQGSKKVRELSDTTMEALFTDDL